MSYPASVAVNTKPSAVIPLAVIGGLSIAQLVLGTGPGIVAMSAAATAMPFLQMRLFGRDLYAVLGMAISMKYVGFALAAKTFYGQTLESHLYNAPAAYALTLLYILVLTGILLLTRALDSGRVLFSLPMDLVSLRRLSNISLGMGMVGNVFYAMTFGDTGGALLSIGVALRQFIFLGLIAETVYAVFKSEGKSFVTARLAFWFAIIFVLSTAFNNRELVVSAVISIIITAFVYNVIYIRHVMIGIISVYLFIFYVTPVTFYLRLYRTGLSFSEFADVALNTVSKAATDPQFLKLISDTGANAYNQGEQPYDYYGLRSEVLDRLSWVSLVDAVYNGTRTREPLGMDAVEQLLTRAAPGFLNYDKSVTNSYGPGDWLAWQIGLEAPDVTSYTVFGLPMEGLASWGLAGFILYPVLFMFPVLYACSVLSSLRLPLPVSIFLVAETVHMMSEGTADFFPIWLTRDLPLTALVLFTLHYFLRDRRIPVRARAI